MHTGLGVFGDTQSAAQAANNAPTGFWDAVGQFFNPSISTSTLMANYYQGVQNGQIPPIPEATATETPQQYATRVQAAIQAAEDAGTYSPSPALGMTATDLSNTDWTPILLGGGIALVALLVLIRR